MTRVRLAAVPLVWVLGATAALASCSSTSPESRLQERLDAITTSANDRDADAVRNAVEAFLAEVEVQSRDGMPSSRVTRLRALAAAVLRSADLIDKRVTDARASASAKARAEASRRAAEAAEASARARAEAEAEASRRAAAEASRSAAAASASAAATAEPTDEGILPTSAPGEGKKQGRKGALPAPSPTP